MVEYAEKQPKGCLLERKKKKKKTAEHPNLGT